MPDLRAVAYHEAGHAVATIARNRRFRRASIVEEEDSLGRVLHDKPLVTDNQTITVSYDLDDCRARRAVETSAMISLAGPIAEAKATGRENPEGAGVVPLEPEAAERLGIPSVLHPGTDYDQVLRLLEAATASNYELIDAWWRFLEVRAKLLLEGWWFLVEPVAEALMQRKTLSYDEVRDLHRDVARERFGIPDDVARKLGLRADG